MKCVEVDARGLGPKLAIAIARRALTISCGKPVIMSFDSPESRDKVIEFAQGRKLSCIVGEQDGCYRVEIARHAG
ncbi:MAG TPA: hypothetical protein PLT03_04275 [Bacillota bacterium]|nr:hypothetical protein [Bacillota bacterium]HOA15116.1 hypothetical protein [Bacillota bacterium]HOG53070.1 hypothetical protein [Bacillota bacterium]